MRIRKVYVTASRAVDNLVSDDKRVTVGSSRPEANWKTPTGTPLFCATRAMARADYSIQTRWLFKVQGNYWPVKSSINLTLAKHRFVKSEGYLTKVFKDRVSSL